MLSREFAPKDMFDKAKLPYPTDDWTWDDLRALARKLTLDKNGRNAEDSAFDPNSIVQWGYSHNPGAIAAWAHFFIEPFGGDFCANLECSRLNLTSEADLNALQWWADFIQKDHATLYDPYTGGQTGVPGDPFLAGKAAMGNSGFFAIGQLRDAASFKWDIVQPPKGPTDKRASAFSTAGWVISAQSKHPREAWRLIQELTSPEFLETVWAKPGHSVPSRRSAAQVVLKLSPPPSNYRCWAASRHHLWSASPSPACTGGARIFCLRSSWQRS